MGEGFLHSVDTNLMALDRSSWNVEAFGASRWPMVRKLSVACVSCNADLMDYGRSPLLSSASFPHQKCECLMALRQTWSRSVKMFFVSAFAGKIPVL